MAGQPELALSRSTREPKRKTKDFFSATKDKKRSLSRQPPQLVKKESQVAPNKCMKLRSELKEQCKHINNVQGKITKDQGVVKLRDAPAYNRQSFSDLVHKVAKQGMH